MVGADYCTLPQVQSALYAGEGLAPGDPAPTDATRDARLSDLITKTSHDFDHEVAGPNYPGLFAPRYEVRVFSGQGNQVLDIDPLLALAPALAIQYNSTPGRTPTWVDVSGEMATYQMGLLPVGPSYPKHRLFRQGSWFVDPFPLGNIQILGVWGVCLPDPAVAIPNQPWQGITVQGTINAMAPPGGGWWVTPPDVVDAVTEWVVYKFEHGKAAYAEAPGPATLPGVTDTRYPADIPKDVARVIAKYKGEDSDSPKFALVGNEPTDTPYAYRWRGWLTT